jgi:hypothetical protein
MSPCNLQVFARREKGGMERLYSTATIMASPRTAADTGEFADLSELSRASRPSSRASLAISRQKQHDEG